MFEIPRRGRQVTNFECSENSRSQIVFPTDIFRKLAFSAPDCVECLIKQNILPGEIKDAEMSNFSSDFQTLININFLCIFFMNY